MDENKLREMINNYIEENFTEDYIDSLLSSYGFEEYYEYAYEEDEELGEIDGFSLVDQIESTNKDAQDHVINEIFREIEDHFNDIIDDKISNYTEIVYDVIYDNFPVLK